MEQVFPSEDYINRRTEFRFDGKNIKMDLSLGLFSSAGIDSGSYLLLKTLVHAVDLDGLTSILDSGCGAGTLGLALGSRCPQAKVHMIDRDAMAVAFSRHNSKLNKLKNTSAVCRLITEEPEINNYNLIVCNFPAKAGEPVLNASIKHLMQLTAPGGRCAMVIVYTLSDICRKMIYEFGGEILLEESSKQHTVYHFRSKESAKSSEEKQDFPHPYLRHQGKFHLGKTNYQMATVWNLPEFDNLSWATELMGNLLAKKAHKGSMVFWEPGQGHLPSSVCRRMGAKPQKVLLAGRDRLSLLTSMHNLKLNSPQTNVEIKEISTPDQLAGILPKGQTDLLLTKITPVPLSKWAVPLRAAAGEVVKPGGLWAMLGKSSDMALLTKTTKGWTPLADRRSKGSRALIYRRNS